MNAVLKIERLLEEIVNKIRLPFGDKRVAEIDSLWAQDGWIAHASYRHSSWYSKKSILGVRRFAG